MVNQDARCVWCLEFGLKFRVNAYEVRLKPKYLPRVFCKKSHLAFSSSLTTTPREDRERLCGGVDALNFLSVESTPLLGFNICFFAASNSFICSAFTLICAFFLNLDFTLRSQEPVFHDGRRLTHTQSRS
jgi:hypothetical protein